MDRITIRKLEVRYRVGITAAERAQPQRLLLTIVMERDLARSASTDDLAFTIDYSQVCDRLLRFGEEREWQLIETVASDIAAMVLQEFAPDQVEVEVQKFVIPQARYVAVTLVRTRGGER